ncbi:hypothetical protein HDU86_005318 [Geranomyces michiganensis]|nr:hypothetical protein HDU86_005318 [Geranomyces michiganensis]
MRELSALPRPVDDKPQEKHKPVILLDLFAAVSSAFLVAPAVTIIDRYGLYFATYAAANVVESIGNYGYYEPAMPKFLAASVTNVTMNVLKDRFLTTSLGTRPQHPIQPITYALYGGRDCLTVFASFTLPPILAPMLQSSAKIGHKESMIYAQFLSPVLMQVISTPVHLLGIDIYNRPGLPLAERYEFIKRGYLQTTGVRMFRKIPAFGLGGFTNSWIRETGYDWYCR